MTNSSPFEIIAAPFEIYTAPVATAFPLIDVAPGGSWTLLGTSGADNYFEEGVSIQHGQSMNFWRALGDNGPRKAFRTEESLVISVTIADMTLEEYMHALNGNTITTTAAGAEAAGYKDIGLSRGLDVTQSLTHYTEIATGSGTAGKEGIKKTFNAWKRTAERGQRQRPAKATPATLALMGVGFTIIKPEAKASSSSE